MVQFEDWVLIKALIKVKLKFNQGDKQQLTPHVVCLWHRSRPSGGSHSPHADSQQALFPLWVTSHNFIIIPHPAWNWLYFQSIINTLTAVTFLFFTLAVKIPKMFQDKWILMITDPQIHCFFCLEWKWKKCFIYILTILFLSCNVPKKICVMVQLWCHF